MVFSAAVMAVVSCGTKKAAVDGRTQASGLVVGRGGAVADAQAVLRKVYANQADARCISSKIKFTLRNGRKDLSVSGSLRMKKDEVVRIQLTAFGLMEVGRLEFTKDYVLLMDRMNKAVYGMTWEERDRLFLCRSEDNSEKERKNEA